LHAAVDSFGTRINPDIAVIFLNTFRPISTDYSGQLKEVFLRNHEFLQILSSRLEK
jgi:hypothetical protein